MHLSIEPIRQGEPQRARRLFSNDQLIQRFDKWLEVTGKSAHTRSAYTYTVEQFALFLDDKPLNIATADDTRAFLVNLFETAISETEIVKRIEAAAIREIGQPSNSDMQVLCVIANWPTCASRT
jgi:hypothetical protein